MTKISFREDLRAQSSLHTDSFCNSNEGDRSHTCSQTQT